MLGLEYEYEQRSNCKALPASGGDGLGDRCPARDGVPGRYPPILTPLRRLLLPPRGDRCIESSDGASKSARLLWRESCTALIGTGIGIEEREAALMA